MKIPASRATTIDRPVSETDAPSRVTTRQPGGTELMTSATGHAIDATSPLISEMALVTCVMMRPPCGTDRATSVISPPTRVTS
jgi:hypothetical protein